MDSGNRRTTSEAQVEDATDVTVAAAPSGGYRTSKHDALIDPPMDSTGNEELPSGTLLGEYKIEGKIGEGGMGVVYSAVHPRIGKRAAIKILRRELCQDASQVRRFVDEARVVNEIGHPNIVDVFAFGDMPDGRCYFVMEWLKGQSLRARLDAGLPSLADIGAVVRPLARALEAAHEKQIIHRDLKPDNIFLVDVRGAEPTVKLLDFGIAKLVRSDKKMDKTATGTMIGTPQYIAPEQARGYAIDHSVDTYSLGGILFEMLTGRTPFLADNAMDMVAKHLLEIAPRVSTLRPDVPVELDDTIYAMLAKEPAARPTMAAVLEVFDRISATRTFDARASTPSGMAWAPQSAPQSASVVSPVSITPAAPVRVPTALGQVADAGSTEIELPQQRSPWVIVLLAGGVVVMAVLAFVIVRMTSGDDTTTSDTPRVEYRPPPAQQPAQQPAATPAQAPPHQTPPPQQTAPATPPDPLPAPPHQIETTPPTTPPHVTRPPHVTHPVPPPPHTVPKPPPPPQPPTFTVPPDDGLMPNKP
jgi:serine/threonine-protein kinase|nr:serine/threonine-protein kinase [Kofleriaceae bacterium]